MNNFDHSNHNAVIIKDCYIDMIMHTHWFLSKCFSYEKLELFTKLFSIKRLYITKILCMSHNWQNNYYTDPYSNLLIFDDIIQIELETDTHPHETFININFINKTLNANFDYSLFFSCKL